MHSIVTTFREAVIKVEVANFGAAIDTLIDQDEILVVALILLCIVISMCVLPILGDNASCCQDKHRSNMSSNILNKKSAVAD